MAIKLPTRPAATPAVPDPDGIPLSIPRHGRDKRPKIRVGSSAKFTYYSRASSFGKTVADLYNLHRWDLRVVVWGMSRDRSLVLAAQAVPAWEDKADPVAHDKARDDLTLVVDQAREVAKADRAAMRGTALHTLSEQADAGVDLSHLDESTRLALNTWRDMMSMFRLIATEVFVVHDGWGAAGSADRVGILRVEYTIRDGDGQVLAVLPAGTAVGIDLKSGRTSDYWGIEYVVQLAVYVGGTPYVHLDDAAAAAGDDGRRSWPGGHTPNQDWALIPHVPVDAPEDAGLMWVDLRVGRACAELVGEVRAARRAASGAFYAGPILTVPGEVVAPAPAVAGVDEGLAEVMVELIGAAPDEAAIDALYDQHVEDWCEEFTAAAEARMAELDGAPAPMTQVDLIAAIRATAAETELDELYRAHPELWTSFVVAVSVEHMRVLDAAGAPA